MAAFVVEVPDPKLVPVLELFPELDPEFVAVGEAELLEGPDLVARASATMEDEAEETRLE